MPMGTATGAETAAPAAAGDDDMNLGEDDGLRPSLADAKGVDVELVGVNILGDDGDRRAPAAVAGAGSWLGPREEGRSGRHLTVTMPVLGSDRNHSERWRIRSVCLWWTWNHKRLQ